MNNQKKLLSPRVIIQLLLFIVLILFLPLLVSWRWNWWEAWVYASCPSWASRSAGSLSLVAGGMVNPLSLNGSPIRKGDDHE